MDSDENLLDADLLEALALDTLVPQTLARWRPLVTEGVLFFLKRLAPAHLEEIVATQFALPLDADPHQRVVALLAQCPTLHKLGQVVARDPRLDPQLRGRLQTLESLPATTPMAQILERIRLELPDGAPVTLADEALAEASVAVVVPFTWTEHGVEHHGVFKVLKPDIETRLDQELAIWGELADHLEIHATRLGLPALDYRETLDSVRDLLAREVHLDVEQANLRAAAAFYADEPRVQVPRVLPWCTPRLTAMERVFGVKLTEAAPALRRALAETAIGALLGRPFWSEANQAVIHADPHAGNLFATTDGRLAVLDWSLTARLAKSQREAVVQAVLGALTLDGGRVRRAVAGLGKLDADHPYLGEAVERALGQVVQGQFPGFQWLVTLLDDVATHAAAGFREDLILFRKAWLTLSGVLGDLSGEVSADRVLLAMGLKRFFSELPERSVAPASTRDFATHVSNADLWLLGATAGLVPAGFWLRLWRQALNGEVEA